jgi:nucleoside-diphosphate-sugar epimerase
MINPINRNDLQHIFEHTTSVWEELADGQLFITGGTGFFGKWLLETLCFSIDMLRLKTQIYVLTRNKDRFEDECPHLARHQSIHFIQGDIQTIEINNAHFTHVIHAASDGTKQYGSLYNSITRGTQNLLEICAKCKASKVLFTSSGAVYGKQPTDLLHIPETYGGAPDSLDISSTYGQSKRIAEHLCLLYAREAGFEIKIARCFAFIGPSIPFNVNLAAGNFLRDALSGNPILIKGDGTPLRSYLYAADLSIWLLTMLVKGKNQTVYNLGSENEISIASLATNISNGFIPPPPVIISKQAIEGLSPERYIPSTQRARQDLGLEEWIPLKEAIQRTINYYII